MFPFLVRKIILGHSLWYRTSGTEICYVKLVAVGKCKVVSGFGPTKSGFAQQGLT